MKLEDIDNAKKLIEDRHFLNQYVGNGYRFTQLFGDKVISKDYLLDTETLMKEINESIQKYFGAGLKKIEDKIKEL